MGRHPSLAVGSTTSRMASQPALGAPFVMPGPGRYKEVVLFNITLAWGTEVQAFTLSNEQSQVKLCHLRPDMQGYTP